MRIYPPVTHLYVFIKRGGGEGERRKRGYRERGKKKREKKGTGGGEQDGRVCEEVSPV